VMPNETSGTEFWHAPLEAEKSAESRMAKTRCG
jgi:hypothetical protein